MTATPTFSVSVGGVAAGSPGATSVIGTTAKNYLLPDSSVDGIAVCTAGGMASAMQQGEPFLAKGPDGALHWYTLAPGSTFANPILSFLGP